MAWKKIKQAECPHLTDMKEGITSDAKACACGVTGDLRMCLTCGNVACCESHNSHDTEHFKQTGHALIKPHNEKYDFLWCYKCNAFLE